MPAIPMDFLIRFGGKWTVWRRYPSRRQARQGLRYWCRRCSWLLKLADAEP